MNLPPDKSIQLRILSAPAYLPVVRAATERICELIGFDPDSRGGIILSLDEALTNIIRHAYEGADDQPIEIQLTPFHRGRDKGVQIRLRDYGRVADPSKIKSRDLEDVRPGGLGVHIMNECMDEVEYHPAEGGGTLLTMVKTLGSKTKAKTNE